MIRLVVLILTFASVSEIHAQGALSNWPDKELSGAWEVVSTDEDGAFDAKPGSIVWLNNPSILIYSDDNEQYVGEPRKRRQLIAHFHCTKCELLNGEVIMDTKITAPYKTSIPCKVKLPAQIGQNKASEVKIAFQGLRRSHSPEEYLDAFAIIRKLEKARSVASTQRLLEDSRIEYQPGAKAILESWIKSNK